jgi:hypothetical protein
LVDGRISLRTPSITPFTGNSLNLKIEGFEATASNPIFANSAGDGRVSIAVAVLLIYLPFFLSIH